MKQRDSTAPREAPVTRTSGKYPRVVGRVEHGHEPVPSRRVLLAEDDDGLRSMLATHLRAEGYAVTEAHDGGELRDALELTPTGYFDLVIADHRMPLATGLEVLARAGGRAPFLLITGVDDEVVRASAERFGAAALLHKPVDLDHLMDVVARLVRTDAEPDEGPEPVRGHTG